MAFAFTLINADRARRAGRLEEMKKAVELGNNRFPTEVTKLHRLW